MATKPWFWKVKKRRRTRYRPASVLGFIVLITTILGSVLGMQIAINPNFNFGVEIRSAGAGFALASAGALIWACLNRSQTHPFYPSPDEEFL